MVFPPGPRPALQSVLAALLCLALWPAPCPAEVLHSLSLEPGTPAEAAVVVNRSASTAEGGARRAAKGGGWTYRVVLPPRTRCQLTYRPDGPVTLRVLDSAGKPLPTRTARAGALRTLHVTAPARHALGAPLSFQFRASSAPMAVRDVRLLLLLPDANGDGVSDAADALMGLPPKRHAEAAPRPESPRTSFQTGDAYSPAIGVPADAVLVYSADPAVYATWAAPGYTLQTMGGFREGEAYAAQHPDELQRDRAGKPITIGGNSYYLLPTRNRLEAADRYYASAIGAGSTAICPEEPEIFAAAGYGEAFKQEWQARYGSPWQPPDSSVDTRYRAEQLKAFLTVRQVENTLNAARALKPSVTRMVAVHSPVTYYQWGIDVPHAALAAIPSLEGMIGQVWTGTARSAAQAAGVRAERTFEVGYLEYSSMANLLRGTGKRLWFLMDPVEDDPNRTMEDYRGNYHNVLLAAMMFPEVDRYEVMPWPQRIYGRVPGDYATMVNTVVGALSEMWRYSTATVESGTAGIGTFVADSMAWQRAEPWPSDFDGFHGLSLPFVAHGVPVQVLSLDRSAEPGYLNRARVLFLSYDFLKPARPELHRALSAWVRRGGTLVLSGGVDPYAAVSDSWWRRAGRATPLDDLFAQLGIATARAADHAPSAQAPPLSAVLTGDPRERALRNRKVYGIDLTPYTRTDGSATVRFEDASPEDGWGPYVASVELRINGRLAAAFRAGSDLETRFLSDERDSRFDGEARFADGSGYWQYRFDGLPRDATVGLRIDMGNGFLVKTGPGGPPPPILDAADPAFDTTLAHVRVPRRYALSAYVPPAGAAPLYRARGSDAPVAWQAPVGSGHVLYFGVAPGFFTATAQSSRLVRALARRACATGGEPYQERAAFVCRRGPYTAIRTLGAEYEASGRFVDLLDPGLPLLEDPTIPARRAALYIDAPSGRLPRLLAAAGRVLARSETPAATGFIVRAPSGTSGVARLSAGSRRLVGVRASTLLGAPVAASAKVEGATVQVRYANDAEGVIVRAAWR
ncbi:MAG: hypothetical protein IT208_07550 [Chthonomonadales bacterium]|nr:hypothetical protein [Chthonomonadales bacterium]